LAFKKQVVVTKEHKEEWKERGYQGRSLELNDLGHDKD
jgi:hypothetical protein